VGRASIAGMTDYSHQSLDDIVSDLRGMTRHTREDVRRLEGYIDASRKSGYWETKVPLGFKGCVSYALKYYATLIEEVDDIQRDLAGEVKSHHCSRLHRLAHTAREINNQIGKTWHQDYELKEYEDQQFKMVEAIYALARDMVANLLDLANIANRLEDFVGRGKSLVRGPWVSGSFYLVAVLILLAVVAAIAKLVSWYALSGGVSEWIE
jgi:hypothetical protein